MNLVTESAMSWDGLDTQETLNVSITELVLCFIFKNKNKWGMRGCWGTQVKLGKG